MNDVSGCVVRSGREPDCADGWERQVLDAAGRYASAEGDHYDDVLKEVSKRLAQSGSAGKLDLAGLAVWKRSAQGSQWIKQLMLLPEREVRSRTAAAFEADSDDARLRLLSRVPGLASSGPLATALLCAWDPVEYAVMDSRAFRGLRHLGCDFNPSLRGRARTVAYLTLTRRLRDGVRALDSEFLARDVDCGPYVLGAPSSAVSQ